MATSNSILLVEDDPNDVELTMEALAANNLSGDVVRVKHGLEAMDYLRCENDYAGRVGGNPTVVLLDLKMPKMNGVEVLKEIRSDENLRSIPVVMLTSSREETDLTKSYELGVNAYVVKPVDFDQFIEAVKQIGAFWGVLNQGPAPSPK